MLLPVNVGPPKSKINMDAVAEMGQIIKKNRRPHRQCRGFGCAKLVVFSNAVEDNPFMVRAFTGRRGGVRQSTWASLAPAWSTTPCSR